MRGTDRSMMGRGDKKYGTSGYVRELQRERERERGFTMVITKFIYRTEFSFIKIISYRFCVVISVYVCYTNGQGNIRNYICRLSAEDTRKNNLYSTTGSI